MENYIESKISDWYFMNNLEAGDVAPLTVDLSPLEIPGQFSIALERTAATLERRIHKRKIRQTNKPRRQKDRDYR